MPNEDHAVLAAHVNGEWLILDNRTLALVRDSDVVKAQPKFILDQDGAHRVIPSNRVTASIDARRQEIVIEDLQPEFQHVAARVQELVLVRRAPCPNPTGSSDTSGLGMSPRKDSVTRFNLGKNQYVERVFNSSRKDHHWGRRKLARDR